MQGSVVLIAEFVTGNKGRAHGNLDESIYHHTFGAVTSKMQEVDS
jgi:hypothetical protein